MKYIENNLKSKATIIVELLLKFINKIIYNHEHGKILHFLGGHAEFMEMFN